MGVPWPLVGRTEQIQTIGGIVWGSGAGTGGGVVVCGAAGVGKSRIVREVLAAAEARGYETRWAVGASAARSVPLGSFSAWQQAGGADTPALVRGVIDALTATASGAPVLVGVDDAHLLDELSMFVVHQIVQRSAAKVVLTVRDGEPVPAALQEIWRAGQFERLDLPALSLAETAELLAAALGAAVDHDATRRLWTLTGGNALYLRNIVEQEVGDGRIVRQRGQWRWIGDPVMPRGLIELIESRIGTLPAPVGDVIDTLAVGEPVDLAALTRITSADAVEEADIRGLISLESVGGGGVQVRVAHPLYGEVRRARAAPTRLRRLRGLVVAELAAADDCDDLRVVVRRATLSLESDVAPDAPLLVAAARGAVWLADLALAERLGGAAIRAGAGAEASFVRAHALSWLGRGREADALLAALPADQLTDADRARFAFLRASNMLWALGEPARAKALIDEAARTIPAAARACVDAFLEVYWFATDEPRKASEAAVHLVLDELPAVVGAEMAWVRTVIAADGGRTAEAVATAEAGYRAATRSLEAPQIRFNIADAHVGALLAAGLIDDAVQVAERVRSQAVDLPGAAELLGAAVAGRAALAAGRLDAARGLLRHATEMLSAAGHATGWGYRYQIPYVTALAMCGRIDDAARALDTLAATPRAFRSLNYERSLARAWLAAGQGAVSEAVGLLSEAAAAAAAQGQFAAEVLLLQAATQFGDRTGTARLAELETVVEGPRVGAVARFAAALCAGDPAELLSVSKEFERIGDLVAAADAAAHAAAGYRGREMRGSALGCSTRAAALAEQCGGADTPALRRVAEPLPLTERELEIVTLIGARMTNRAIAQRLTLSVRTVESHVYQAMQRTGTTSREELAALVSRPRTPRV